MAKQVTLDFSKAPPAQGGRRYDLVPEGTYQLEVAEADVALARNGSGRNVISVGFIVADGEYIGKRVGNQFTMPNSTTDAIFGLQQFHQLLVSCGSKVLSGKANLDLSVLSGRMCIAEVQNEKYERKDGTQGESSRPVAFHRVGEKVAKAAPAKVKAAPEPEEPTGEEVSVGDDEAAISVDDIDSLFE